MSTLRDRQPVARATTRQRAVGLAVVLVAAVLVGVSVLSLRVFGDGGPTTFRSGTLPVAGGTLTVDRVAPEVQSHPKGMPAGMMPDPVPDGFRRVSVDVTIRSTEDGSMAYASDQIDVDAPDMSPTVPIRSTLDEGTLSEGERVTGSLLFQIPDDVRVVTLSVAGDERGLRVEIPRATGHGKH